MRRRRNLENLTDAEMVAIYEQVKHRDDCDDQLFARGFDFIDAIRARRRLRGARTTFPNRPTRRAQ